MLFYFTATGNSLHAAKALDADRRSIAQAIHDENKVYKAEKIGIVCPVFGHEVPELVKDFLRQARFETDYFFAILTYGNRHGGASELAKSFLEEIGIQPAYINLVLMVDNWLPGFDMEEQKRLDKRVDEQLARIAADLQTRKRFISPVTEQDREHHRGYLERRAKQPPELFQRLYRITEDCIGCGICVKVCPRACFTVEAQKSRWNPAGCITCLACAHACPMTAIQLNIPEKNPKARYRNENVSICEIVAANNQHPS